MNDFSAKNGGGVCGGSNFLLVAASTFAHCGGGDVGETRRGSCVGLVTITLGDARLATRDCWPYPEPAALLTEAKRVGCLRMACNRGGEPPAGTADVEDAAAAATDTLGRTTDEMGA